MLNNLRTKPECRDLVSELLNSPSSPEGDAKSNAAKSSLAK